MEMSCNYKPKILHSLTNVEKNGNDVKKSNYLMKFFERNEK